MDVYKFVTLLYATAGFLKVQLGWPSRNFERP